MKIRTLRKQESDFWSNGRKGKEGKTCRKRSEEKERLDTFDGMVYFVMRRPMDGKKREKTEPGVKDYASTKHTQKYIESKGVPSIAFPACGNGTTIGALARIKHASPFSCNTPRVL